VQDLPRSSGIQLHLTSLPGGRLGAEAYRFADWLAEAGQSWWQVLPLGPPDRYRSPYKSKSAFAAWPGFLASPDAPVSAGDVSDFVARHEYWIGDWSRFGGGRRAVEDQVRFDREWGDLRRYCDSLGIRLLGDVAIYVAPGSVDHRAHPELFRSGVVAGAPPDAFSDEGQLWGNPLYDWPALRRRRYRWWVERARRTLSLFDVARIDHFRGFVAYWAVPASASTAVEGRWVRGAGRAVFDAIASGVGGLPFVAEDLGVITPPVDRLRDSLGLPGMLVLQFGFEPSEPRSVHRLSNHLEHRFVYTGTHDHDTAFGWWEGLDASRRGLVEDELAARGLAGPDVSA
jgi:4-alpha-glucanotransferase